MIKHERGTYVSIPAELNLDPNDVIDSGFIAFHRQVQTDAFPSLVEQKTMLDALQNGEPSAASDLIAAHSGLIAAVAYPFKTKEKPSEDILAEAEAGFWRATTGYDPRLGQIEGNKVDFSDYAILTMQNVLTNGPSAVLKPASAYTDMHPMDAILSSASGAGSRTKPRNMEAIISQGLASQLGRASLEGIDLETLMQAATPKQREYIQALYFGNSSIADLRDGYGVTRSVIIHCHDKGIARMRDALEEMDYRPEEQTDTEVSTQGQLAA